MAIEQSAEEPAARDDEIEVVHDPGSARADFALDEVQVLDYHQLQGLLAAETGAGGDDDGKVDGGKGDDAAGDGVPSARELVAQLLARRAAAGRLGEARGILQVRPEGFGFLRFARHAYRNGADDIYVSPSQVRRLRLREGDEILGPVRPPQKDEGYLALLRIDRVNGQSLPQAFQRVPFPDLTPVLPTRRLLLDTGDEACRLIDHWAPAALGHRLALHVPAGSPRLPLLVALARGLRAGHPDALVMVLQVGERPEDAVALRQQLGADDGHRELLTCPFDEPPPVQTNMMDLALARARRQVEVGRDVVMLVDSLTRLVRAHNLVVPHSGKIICPELDAAALLPAKALFASARQVDGGGSLTVLATVLHDTGARMDEVLAEELQHRANADVVLDAGLCEEHGHLGIDVAATRTRREDSPLPPEPARQLREERAALPGDKARALAAARATLARTTSR